jgi:hypothetical protein
MVSTEIKDRSAYVWMQCVRLDQSSVHPEPDGRDLWDVGKALNNAGFFEKTNPLMDGGVSKVKLPREIPY